MVRIRAAQPSDIGAITAVYNEAVQSTTATFDTEPKTEVEQAAWFRSHDSRHPIMVAEENGVVVAWAALSEWSSRQAYADTAESSVYVKEGFRGRGIGRKLKEALLEEGRRVRLHTVIARVAEGNEVSLHLNESLGFRRIGVMKEVGRKFGLLLDVHLMQKIYASEEGGTGHPVNRRRHGEERHPPGKGPRAAQAASGKD